MSDVTLLAAVSMFCALGAYVVWAWRSVHTSAGDVATLKASADIQAVNVAGIDTRLRRVESALKIDGAKLVAAAARENLPAMMR